MKKVLITGASGYIGSHIIVALCKMAKYQIVALDDGSNSDIELTQSKLRTICKDFELFNETFPSHFYQLDLRSWSEVNDNILSGVDVVIHCAGWKSVNESVENALSYYDNNVCGTVKLLQAMERKNVRKIVFSSSATVYGVPETLPINENSAVKPTNPYGQTKAMIEQMIKDVSKSSQKVKAVLLRYFNPCGGHESALIGEMPKGVPNNLQPYIAQVASGKRKCLNVFGNDWPTPDGTPIRDYIHVCDLAEAHVLSVDYIMKEDFDCETINLGTGRGYSVLEMIKAFEKACGKTINYHITERRPGDVAEVYADASRAKLLLNWTAKKNLDEMCNDSWTFVQKNLSSSS